MRTIQETSGEHKNTNICVIEVLEGGERIKGAENMCKDTVAKHFPNLGKERVTQIHEDRVTVQGPKTESHTELTQGWTHQDTL